MQVFVFRGVSTYVGLYGSGLFNFGSYANLPTLCQLVHCVTKIIIISLIIIIVHQYNRIVYNIILYICNYINTMYITVIVLADVSQYCT